MVELVLWALRRRRRFRVQGNSMLPVLADHDEVLIDPHADLAAGDLVLARHPFRKDIRMIKRLVRFETGGKAHLEGLNAEQSTDSRTLGDLPTDLLLGKVTSRF